MPRVLAIAGGVGGAKLAVGLSSLLTPEELTIVVNTGDDEYFHGLHVSPDIDTVTYALAGLSNTQTGWGVANDSFRVLQTLERLGAETWFKMGDLDLGLHIRRTELLASGCTLSETTAAIAASLGVRHPIVPMSDDPIRTITLTDVGELPFQEYFVKYSCEPKILGVRFDGLERARPSEGFAKALRESDAIVLCPSNPVVSIGPVLAIPGVHECFESFAGPRLGVSPIVGGQALKGPAAKMMIELGEQSSNVGVASRYLGLLDTLVIDNTDRWEGPGIEALGIAAYVTSTVMGSGRDKTRLGKEILHLITDKLASMQASRG